MKYFRYWDLGYILPIVVINFNYDLNQHSLFLRLETKTYFTYFICNFSPPDVSVMLPVFPRISIFLPLYANPLSLHTIYDYMHLITLYSL